MNIPHFGLAKQYVNLKDELLEATDQVLSSGILMNGPFTTMFEDWLTTRTKAKYAITCHSGTQALEIIAKHYANIYLNYYDNRITQPTVLIPNLSYPATLNAWLSTGWKVKLVDTDHNGLMIRQNIGLVRSETIECVVGLYGANPNHQNTWEHGTVIDGAQHWLCPNVTFGYGMAISFDPTKNLPSSGNGGAIITDNTRLRDFAISYRSNGTPNFYEQPGSNSRMSEQDCAHILVRTQYISEWQARRRKIRLYWLDQFKDMPFRCLSREFEYHADQKFVIWTDNRKELDVHLYCKGIQTKIHYQYTLGELPISKNIPHPDAMSMSVMLSRGVLSLPIYPELTDVEIEYIANTIKKFYSE